MADAAAAPTGLLSVSGRTGVHGQAARFWPGRAALTPKEVVTLRPHPEASQRAVLLAVNHGVALLQILQALAGGLELLGLALDAGGVPVPSVPGRANINELAVLVLGRGGAQACNGRGRAGRGNGASSFGWAAAGEPGTEARKEACGKGAGVDVQGSEC